MIIDFHTHIFPEKIADRAMSTLSASSGFLAVSNGTLNGLKNSMKEAGVDKSVVLGIATNAHQQSSVNDFMISLKDDGEIIPFGSVYPDAPDAILELERIKAAGLKGIKLHPEYQQFFVDDEKMKPIYKKASELGLIVVFHAGFDYGYPAPYHCMPENLKNALKWLDTPVVAAHFGGQNCTQGVLDILCGIENIYFDISFGYGTIAKPTAEMIIKKHGTDRILFGSDSPWHNPAWEKHMVENFNLTTEEKNMIFYKNAAMLLNI